MNILQRILLGFGLIACITQTQAQLRIKITKPAQGAIPIAILPFEGNDSINMAGIIRDDLERSGRFIPLPIGNIPQRAANIGQIQPDAWTSTGVTYASMGSVTGNEVVFELGDVLNLKALTGYRFTPNDPRQMRRVAHQIADLIYEKLTGEAGAFDSRMAYINRAGNQYSLVVADADGAAPEVILSSNEPIFSPSWSPDSNRLAYVTLENKQARIVVQDLFSGSRTVISEAPGINSAPSWSPDGGRLVFTLSKDGNPEIYTASSSGGGQLSRLTNNPAIDTEPVWAPNGSIYFTSDRGGAPQIYRMPASGGEATRVTFEGAYNAKPSISSDGKQLAMMHRASQGFGIAVLDLQTGGFRELSSGGKDESPSFSPNGRMIIYANGRGGLEAISSDGRVRQSLSGGGADVREPAWSSKLR